MLGLADGPMRVPPAPEGGEGGGGEGREGIVGHLRPLLA